ncbi:hypothetical protein PILCRDRAFT_809909 [Piloderma croceum F 1598]|uniref:Ribosomal protein S5 domain 2-like protein n=1 Tax=Piloderma croceum (strain F 1598) TaxID=765440 RepID=A0A0C3G6M4_PILCF|nr:hypothetical protein PILCRDRAFT_809909 [Piloderma croceum F 1598]
MLRVLRRCYSATTFVPPSSLKDFQHRSTPHSNADPRPRPESPAFYTGRAQYNDQIISLQSSLQYSRSALTSLHLLPLPKFARDSLPPPTSDWKHKRDLQVFMQCHLSMANYRYILKMLQELNEYRRIAETAGCDELESKMAAILDLFKKGDGGVSKGKKLAKVDEFGRSYTLGRRKTSTARVWMIRAKQPPTPAAPLESLEQQLQDISSPFKLTTPSESLDQILNPPPLPVNLSQILINNLPLSKYFPLPPDRERVVRPLKIAGVLGGYNVFAIVRGGGVTGQSGAVALGLAKGLAVLEPEVEALLKKAKLLRRDPRMVERKKTGLAKARKRYTWVKR